ncbi:hypothetical protein SASPL_151110 [Salvia splendens]|uniref:Uncharacterized protein n=1 Tax=Salvia splendens TaxID=180675 RepID=A0A8X8Z334_SALSN|nr:hypothetical protein SASPL_151110 [Salvia splendens]
MEVSLLSISYIHHLPPPALLSIPIPNPMFMQVLNRYTFSSIALVSFVLCLAAELKKTKKDDLVFNGKLCYLPTSSIAFGVAVVLLSAASSMNQSQAFGEGWLDGECYLVKDGVYIGSAILTLLALGSALGSGIIAVRKNEAEETQGSLVHAKVDK